jgi:hypothetical protein
VNDLHYSAFLGTGGALLQALPVSLDPSFESYGTAGLILGAGWFMLKYFMNIIKEKDEQLKEMHLATLKTHEEFKDELIVALAALTEEIKRTRV